MESRFKAVRALQRGLVLLEALDFLEPRSTTEIAELVSLPRSTALRLLETLEAQGFVRRHEGGLFLLAEKTAGLGDGLDFGAMLGLVSGPVLSELGHEITWPADVFSFEKSAMIIQESTNARSPLSLDPNRIGGRSPILASAAGRAYLAACSVKYQDVILKYLAVFGENEDLALLKERRAAAVLKETTSNGFAVRHGYESKRKTSSIGLAIRQGDDVWGSISMRWLDSALNMSGAIQQFLPHLKNAATQIESEIARFINETSQ